VSGLFLFYFILRIGFHLKLQLTGCQIVNRQSKVLACRAVACCYDFEPAGLHAPSFGAAVFVLASLP
jgi:hypothetical protein